MERRVVMTVVAAAAAVAVLVLAASSGRLQIWDKPGSVSISIPAATVAAPTAAVATASMGADRATEEVRGNLGAIVDVTMIVLLVAGLIALAIYLWRRWRHLLNRESNQGADFDVLPDISKAISGDAAAQFAALAGGTPRNAIVACWLRLEGAIASAGITPNPAETSAELTARVVATYSVDESAIGTLSALYREARFSEHELGEDVRTAAIVALQAVHQDLQTISGTAS